MKIVVKFLSIVTVLASITLLTSLARAQDAPPPPSDQGDDQGASFQTFYDQLGDQGTWVQTDNYGYVFQPNVSDPNWAPYTDGHWVYTDQGWAWVSDEPWGWATYHYGRWANIDGTGWVWVPGYQWAPAWVSWRYGGGYCGWAPLPPETFIGAEYGEPGVNVGIGFHFGSDVDVSFDIGPGCYNFVNVDDMGYPNYRGRYVDRSRNYVIINRTTNITNINVNKNGGAGAGFRGVSVGGPSLAEVNARSRQRVATVQLTAASQPGRSTLQGNSLAVYAPRVNPATLHTARPAQVARTLAHPTFNRGNSITKPLAVTANVRPTAPTAAAIQAAKTAQSNAPATARIATAKTTVREPVSKPLSSLEPVTSTRRTTSSPGANSAFTGESEKPAAKEPSEVKPATTYHPESNFKPQTEAKPEAQVKPTQTYRPETEAKPEAVGKPTQTYRPETEPKPQTEVRPTETERSPQEEPKREAPAPTRTESAPAATRSEAPAAKSSGIGGQGAKPAAGGGGPGGAKQNGQGQ